MIAILKKQITPEEFDQLLNRFHAFGLTHHISQLGDKTLAALTGATADFDMRQISMLPGIQDVFQVKEPFKLASRSWKKDKTTFHVKGVEVGGNQLNLMAGPCAVENEEQINEAAKMLSSRNIRFIRGGAYKPRTSPYSFQGLGKPGLQMLREAADENNLRVVTEVIDLKVLDEVYDFADILQVGTRNMSNFFMLKELGKIDKPVLLKRGMSAKISEWLMAAEYILSGGNEKVILCERGIRTFDDINRNMMDIGAIPTLNELSHLPVFADPSHGIGYRDRVIPMALASVAAGADGILLEVHPEPTKALSDGPQSLFPDQLTELMKKMEPIARVTGKKTDFSFQEEATL